MDKSVNRTFLLTVTADGSTPADVYEGNVTIAPQGAPARQIPIRVRVGLNSIAWTEARPGAIALTDPCAEPNEQFMRWIDLYRDMGFKAMPWDGFAQGAFKEDVRFGPEWTKKYREMIANVRNTGKKRNWPEIIFYLSDELSNHGAEGGADGLKC
jgi:hypothetical protein